MSALTARRRGYDAMPHPPDWHVSSSYQHGRQQLTPGRRLTIAGERGAVFRFVRYVVVEPADKRRRRREWIDVVGGTTGVVMCRSFRPERIKRVLSDRARGTRI